MNHVVDSPYLVPFEGDWRLADAPTDPRKARLKEDDARRRLERHVERIEALQRRLQGEDRQSLLLVFQAMDGAGKDSTIRAVTTGVNPAGFQVSAFKAPSAEELDHDFLWRVVRRLPERGRIGIFNRSHYEEVVVVRVHPQLLDAQRLPDRPSPPELWAQRHASIRDFERHLARNGSTVVKFFLNVSFEEQARRFVARIDDPDKNWKFSAGDVAERAHWGAYMAAYEDALRETSRPWAPWYAIPADDKPTLRVIVADIIERALERMDPRYPEPPDEERALMAALRQGLVEGG